MADLNTVLQAIENAKKNGNIEDAALLEGYASHLRSERGKSRASEIGTPTPVEQQVNPPGQRAPDVSARPQARPPASAPPAMPLGGSGASPVPPTPDDLLGLLGSSTVPTPQSAPVLPTVMDPRAAPAMPMPGATSPAPSPGGAAPVIPTDLVRLLSGEAATGGAMGMPDYGTPTTFTAPTDNVKKRPEPKPSEPAEPPEPVLDLAKRRGQEFVQGASGILQSVARARGIKEETLASAIKRDAPDRVKEAARRIQSLEGILSRGISDSGVGPMTDQERAKYQRDLAEAGEAFKQWSDVQEFGPAFAGNRSKGAEKTAKTVKDWTDETFGVPPKDDSIWSDLAYGGGSMVGFVTPAILAGPFGLPVTAQMGSDVARVEAYDRAIAAGASDEDAQAAANLAGLMGTMEAVPIGHALNRLPKPVRNDVLGRLGRFSREAVLDGTEEAMQEAFAALSQNLIAKGIYDPEQKVITGDVTDQALVGFILGAFLGGSVNIARRDREDETPKPPKQSPEATSDEPVQPGGATGGDMDYPRLSPMAPMPDSRVNVDPGRPERPPEPAPGAMPNRIFSDPGKINSGPKSDRYEVIPEIYVDPETGEESLTGRRVRVDTTGQEPPVVVDEPAAERDAAEGSGPGGSGSSARPAPDTDAPAPVAPRAVTRPVARSEPDRKREFDPIDPNAPVAPRRPREVVDDGEPDAAPAPDPQPEAAPAVQGERNPQKVILSDEEVRAIETDADAFQYKAGGDEKGVTDALKGVNKFDPERAGNVIVYETRDGRRIIADGHQRMGLARRAAAAGQKDVGGVPASIYREVDGYTPADVRVIAAEINIANGTGTALDAAKILREGSASAADLDLPPKSALVRDAEGLRRLSDGAFGMVANGVATEQHGAIVGREVADQDAHASILKLLGRLNPRNAEQAAIIARDAAADTARSETADLFGSQKDTDTLYLERARVLDSAVKGLKKDKATFSRLVREGDKIEGAGNKLDADANTRRVEDDAKVLEYLQRQANTKGPISDALSKAARDLKAGRTLSQAARQFVGDVQRALSADGTTGVEGSRGGETPGPRPEAEGGTPEEPEVTPAPKPGADLFDRPDNAPRKDGKRPGEYVDRSGDKHDDAVFVSRVDELPDRIPLDQLASEARRLTLEPGRREGVEFMMLIDPDGQIVSYGSGGKSETGIPAAMRNLFSDPDAGLIAHHNHPSSNPFSPADYHVGATAGFRGIYAHLHDGTTLYFESTERMGNLLTMLSKAGVKMRDVLRTIKSSSFKKSPIFERLRNADDDQRADAWRDHSYMFMRAMDDVGLIVSEVTGNPARENSDVDNQFFTDPELRKTYDSVKRRLRNLIDKYGAGDYNDRPTVTVRHPGRMEGISGRDAQRGRVIGAGGVSGSVRVRGEGRREADRGDGGGRESGDDFEAALAAQLEKRGKGPAAKKDSGTSKPATPDQKAIKKESSEKSKASKRSAAARTKDIKNILKGGGLADDTGPDPVYEQLSPIFSESIETDPKGRPRVEVFGEMIGPMLDEGLTADEVRALRPYFERFLDEVDAGTIAWQGDQDAAPGGRAASPSSRPDPDLDPIPADQIKQGQSVEVSMSGGPLVAGEIGRITVEGVELVEGNGDRTVLPIEDIEDGETKVFPASIKAADPSSDVSFDEPAYHGSIFDFDRFDTGRIGTGEGAQAFGWGLYFTQRREIAEHYRNQGLRQQSDSQRGEGRIYSVEVPDATDLMAWDVTLAEQPEKVREALLGKGGVVEYLRGDEAIMDYLDPHVNDDFEGLTGREFYQVLKRLSENDYLDTNGPGMQDAYERGRDDEVASLFLRNEGIPGHRFLDAGSRAGGEGTYNYVIYDDSEVEITLKEQRPPIPGGTAMDFDAASAMLPKLRAKLDAMNLKRVTLNVEAGATGRQGVTYARGPGQIDILISQALDPEATLYHESIHAMVMMNLFTPREWTALSRAATVKAPGGEKNWIEKHDIEARYPDLTRSEQIEEAIAEEFAERATSRRAPKSSLLATAFNKIHRVLRAIRSVFTGQSAEDVFGKVLAGQIGARDAGNTGIAASLKPSEMRPDEEVKHWRKGLERIRSGKAAKTDVARLGAPGPVLANFLPPRQPIVMKAVRVRAVIKDHPNVTYGVLAQVAEAIRHPEFVLQSATRADSIVSIPVFVPGGLPLVVAIKRDGTDQNGKSASEITSVYVKDDPEWFKREVNAGRLIYDRDGKYAGGSANRPRSDSASVQQEAGLTPPRRRKILTSRDVFKSGADSKPKEMRLPKFLPPEPKAPKTGADAPAKAGEGFSKDTIARHAALSAQYGHPGVPTQEVFKPLFGAPQRSTLDWNQELFQDRFIMFRAAESAIERATGQKIPESQSFSLKETLFSGRLAERLERLMREEIEPIHEAISRSKVSLDDLGLFLIARHAPERNALMAKRDPDHFGKGNGSGMTDEMAAQYLSEFEDKGMTPTLKRLAKLIEKVLERDLKLRRAAGLITEEEYLSYTSMFEHYVPLRGFAEREEGGQMGTGSGFDIRGKEGQNALGRKSLSDNPVVQALAMRQNGIVRAEKNRAGRTLMRLVQRFPHPDLWEVMHKLPMRRVLDPQTGMVKEIVDFGAAREDNVLAVKVDGETRHILIHDPLMAAAVKNLEDRNIGILAKVVMQFRRLTRAFSRLQTGANPDFVFPNAMSDYFEGLWTAFNVKDADAKKIFAAYKFFYPLALAQGVQEEFGDSAVGRFLTNEKRKRLAKLNGDAVDSETLSKMRKYREEWKLSGGKINFMAFRDLDEITRDVNRAIDKSQRRMWQVRPWEAIESTLQVIEKVNQPVEAAGRLAMYVAARENGLSRERAAALALDASGNYYRKGRATNGLAALYAFFNPAVQGVEKFIRFSKRPRNWAVMGGLMASNYALTAFFIHAFEDEDDPEKRSLYLDIPEFERGRSIVIPTGIVEEDTGIIGDDGEPIMRKRLTYLSFRVPHNLRPILTMGAKLAEVQSGQTDHPDAANEISKSWMMNSNPLGDTSPGNMIAPTVLDPFVDLALNRNFFGGPIRPSVYAHEEGLPKASQYFESSINPVYPSVSQVLNHATGGTSYEPGFADVYPDDIEYLVDYISGGLGRFVSRGYEAAQDVAAGNPPTHGRIPIVRTFSGRTNHYAENDRYYSYREAIKHNQNRLRQAKKDLGANPDNLEAKEAFERYLRELNASVSPKTGDFSWKGSLPKVIERADDDLKALRGGILTIVRDDTLSSAEKRKLIRPIRLEIEDRQRRARAEIEDLVTKIGTRSGLD
ncbi:LPD38 domain-containing protein [Mameliella alba]|uniref:Large polyvalent protein-associated domain-containing protein n=1 Tax=Mameliella alba TaxID=561184 RepID=A0A0B3RIK0_9RHOB|nr:LPD38 domain-containing protein [Mameliella alba]KHQ51095.1 hypothetical protein OA50_04466 [Mameliella alba]